MLEWIRFSLFTLLLTAGLLMEICAVFGVNRFRYSLNRLHAAAVGDTMGVFLVMLSAVVYAGVSVQALKLIFVVVLMWAANPVSGHLISLMVMRTDPKLNREAKIWRS